MTQQNPVNKRAHERFRISVAVEIQSAPGSGFLEGQNLTCLTRDISLTGMCIYTYTEFPADSRLMLTLELGDPVKSFKLLGRVIWSTPDSNNEGCYMAGINLVKLPGDEAAWHNAVLQTLVG